MANIRVDLPIPIYDGMPVTFKAPADCSNITGLRVYYPVSETLTTSQDFTLADANRNDIGNINNLFTANAMVKVILDTVDKMAFVQNADTNAYLEGRFDNTIQKGTELTNEDLDTITVEGRYFTKNNNTCTNKPVTETTRAFGLMVVKSGGTNNIVAQLFFSAGNEKMHYRIYTTSGSWSEWYEITTGSRPTGTYNGNGKTTGRTVSVGGDGSVLIINSDWGMAMVTPGGAFTKSISMTDPSGLSQASANFADGVLTLGTNHQSVNSNGVVYSYQVL